MEDVYVCKSVCTSGNILSALEKFQLPGVDEIQSNPTDQYHSHYVLSLLSTMRARGKEGAMAELFAFGPESHEGDYLAIYGSALFGTSRDIKVLIRALAEKVRDTGKEFITIYYGQDIQEKHAKKAADMFQQICPDADVNLICGGQPVYYYLISAE